MTEEHDCFLIAIIITYMLLKAVKDSTTITTVVMIPTIVFRITMTIRTVSLDLLYMVHELHLGLQ